MRFFNTAGPMVPEDHYSIPPLDRLDLAYVLALVQQKKYFVLRAPRQTGKTSTLLALQHLLNDDGRYRCVYVNVEAGQTGGEDVREAMAEILGELGTREQEALGEEFVDGIWRDSLKLYGPHGAFKQVLRRWARADQRPLVLLIDEIDALVGTTLLSVLRQLRVGYPLRPAGFPQSIVLCGMRDIRDYPIEPEAPGKAKASVSPFNICADSLRLGDFSRPEVEALLGQHSADTGQAFETQALERIWMQTQGQPWLVNALCDQACFRSELGHDRSRSIAVADVVTAQERLILNRQAHIDQLGRKLREDRVRTVVEPLLSGVERSGFSERDLEYVRDLGLIARDAPLRIANPIYAEVVPRELTAATQEALVQDMAWYVDAGGGLDLPKLLTAFQEFYRQHSEHWLELYAYKEAGSQLLLQAFLQRIVHGGGRIEREYGLGRGRTDLLIVWPAGDRTSRFVIECKILRDSLQRTIQEGLAQTAGYMDRCGAEAGHLVIFDQSEGRWADKLFRRREATGDASIDVWGM